MHSIYKTIFEPDSGALLNITIFDTNLDDWQKTVDHLSQRFLLVYSEDGTQKSLPEVKTIFHVRNEKSVMAEVMLAGFTQNCHFFDSNQIEMDLLPEDVDSTEKAEAVFRLMVDVARILNKEVFLVPEFGSATPDKLREMAVCFADPKIDSVQSRFSGGSIYL